ncbi:MAG: hypothetical protein ACJ74Z_16275 [Bryobacteraceae bacterium]|jgi:hypothetical protein
MTDTENTEYMLTTVDNPFDPWTQWDEWFAWDMNAGYHTPGLLARVSLSSENLSEGDQHQAIQQAIDEIVRENVLGVHRKIKLGEFKPIA